MDDPARKVDGSHIYGRKKRYGIPCLKWSEGTGQGAKQLVGTSIWLASMQNRDVWSSLLRWDNDDEIVNMWDG